MDAKLKAGKTTHPQVCWKKIALLHMEIQKFKGGYLFLNDLMLSPNSAN